MNKQPICDNPIDGCMSTGSGYRLCCNPNHKENRKNYPLGHFSPVWHPQAEWPSPTRKARRRTGGMQAHIQWLQEQNEILLAALVSYVDRCPMCSVDADCQDDLCAKYRAIILDAGEVVGGK